MRDQGTRPDPKDAQPERAFQPHSERLRITDDQIRELRTKWQAEGPSSAYSVRMAERALAGDVSAVNACKLVLYGL
jgi:hypothetical protein